MNREDPLEVARAISALGVCGKVPNDQWAILPRGADQAYICFAAKEMKPNPAAKDKAVGRLFIFPGFKNFHRFAAHGRIRDFGIAMATIEIEHYEIVSLESGDAKILKMRPGYVPVERLTETETKILAAVLYECYGFLIRYEEDHSLPLKFAEQKSLFARWQDGSGAWSDGSYRLPLESATKYVEKISFRKDDADKALALPMNAAERWEVDFILLPQWQTREENPRFLYVFAAADAASSARMVWNRMSVGDKVPGIPESDGADALKYLWECHSQRLLRAFLQHGRVPGEIIVHSGRLMRFLRPLAMKIPFKLTFKEKLPALEALIKREITSM